MTFTYAGPNGSGVFAAPKDEVRFLTKDTVESSFSLSDEELAYYLAAAGGNVLSAAAAAASARAGKYSATAKKQITVGPFSTTKDYSANAADMRALAQSLADGSATSSSAPIVSLGDDEWRPAVFDLGMNDGPGVAERYR